MTSTPLITFTTLIKNMRYPSRVSTIFNRIGSISYLTKMPGILFSATAWLCSVTAYWLVISVAEPRSPGWPTLYVVGTTEMKYWKRWKLPGASLTVRSRGLTRDGRKGPKESSEMMCEKLKANYNR